jgi:hypothetical protein
MTARAPLTARRIAAPIASGRGRTLNASSPWRVITSGRPAFVAWRWAMIASGIPKWAWTRLTDGLERRYAARARS